MIRALIVAALVALGAATPAHAASSAVALRAAITPAAATFGYGAVGSIVCANRTCRVTFRGGHTPGTWRFAIRPSAAPCRVYEDLSGACRGLHFHPLDW
jgi:hypothetical protein